MLKRKKITITPEMLDAGEQLISDHYDEQRGWNHPLAERVFRAMLTASSEFQCVTVETISEFPPPMHRRLA